MQGLQAEHGIPDCGAKPNCGDVFLFFIAPRRLSRRFLARFCHPGRNLRGNFFNRASMGGPVSKTARVGICCLPAPLSAHLVRLSLCHHSQLSSLLLCRPGGGGGSPCERGHPSPNRWWLRIVAWVQASATGKWCRNVLFGHHVSSRRSTAIQKLCAPVKKRIRLFQFFTSIHSEAQRLVIDLTADLFFTITSLLQS